MAEDNRGLSEYISDTYSDNKGDEIINVKLPRAKYEILRKMIEREEAATWLEIKWRTHWIWFLAGGIVGIWQLWDKINAFLVKA